MTCNNYINLETIVSKLIFHPGLEINTCPLVQISTFCFATTQKLVSLSSSYTTPVKCSLHTACGITTAIHLRC